jgi:hypothetical protein
LLVLASLCQIAHAGPLKPIADATAACAALQAAQIDAKTKCESAGKTTIRGVGTVELVSLQASGMNRYAIVISGAGKVSMSEPLELTTSICATECDKLDTAKPALRAVTIRGKPGVAAVIDQRYHREKPKPMKRWTATSVIACVAGTCSQKTWGSPNSSCKVQVKTEGAAIATCVTTESLTIEDAHAAPDLDSIMDEAIKAYDRADHVKARELANLALAKQPDNVRMLRLLVSIACLEGDAGEAQKHAKQLPVRDLGQLKTRCERFGVKL